MGPCGVFSFINSLGILCLIDPTNDFGMSSHTEITGCCCCTIYMSTRNVQYTILVAIRVRGNELDNSYHGKLMYMYILSPIIHTRIYNIIVYCYNEINKTQNI